MLILILLIFSIEWILFLNRIYIIFFLIIVFCCSLLDLCTPIVLWNITLHLLLHLSICMNLLMGCHDIGNCLCIFIFLLLSLLHIFFCLIPFDFLNTIIPHNLLFSIILRYYYILLLYHRHNPSNCYLYSYLLLSRLCIC